MKRAARLATLAAACGLAFAGALAASCCASAEPPEVKAEAEAPEEAPKRAKTTKAELEFATSNADGFTPMPKPEPGDWLHRFKEPGQTFAEYVRSRPPGPTKKRTQLVLQPIGKFTETQRARLEEIRAFAALWFALPVELSKKAFPLPVSNRRERTWGEKKWTQYETGYFLNRLAERLPADAIACQGITMADLYPEESWNYVFGQASLVERVGVYSLARYGPEFWGLERDEAAGRLELLRSIKVVTHESGHMFGLMHCKRHLCNMNGSNSLAETDRQPLALCPECLKKLQWRIGFDVRERYEALAAFYEKAGLADEAVWVKKRLARIGEEATAAE